MVTRWKEQWVLFQRSRYFEMIITNHSLPSRGAARRLQAVPWPREGNSRGVWLLGGEPCVTPIPTATALPSTTTAPSALPRPAPLLPVCLLLLPPPCHLSTSPSLVCLRPPCQDPACPDTIGWKSNSAGAWRRGHAHAGAGCVGAGLHPGVLSTVTTPLLPSPNNMNF